MTRRLVGFSRRAWLPLFAGCLCLSLMFAAVATLWSAQERLADSAAVNAALQRFINSGVGGSAAGMTADQLPAEYYLQHGTAAEVSAQLSALVSGLASANGLQILSTGDMGEAPAPDKADGRSTASLQASGTLSAILATLAAVASARPLMIIEKLDIRSDGAGNMGPSGERLLSLSLRVASFTREDEPQPASP